MSLRLRLMVVLPTQRLLARGIRTQVLIHLLLVMVVTGQPLLTVQHLLLRQVLQAVRVQAELITTLVVLVERLLQTQQAVEVVVVQVRVVMVATPLTLVLVRLVLLATLSLLRVEQVVLVLVLEQVVLVVTTVVVVVRVLTVVRVLAAIFLSAGTSPTPSLFIVVNQVTGRFLLAYLP